MSGRSTEAGSRAISTSLVIIAVVAAGAALFFAQEIFIPVALGLLFTAAVPALAAVRIFAERSSRESRLAEVLSE